MINKKYFPNILTSMRIFCAPIFLYFLYLNTLNGKVIALIIFTIGSLTDFFDGRIARKYNIVSQFGIFVDPLADKILVLSAFYSFYFWGPVLDLVYHTSQSNSIQIVQLWMIIIISIRDILITALRMYMKFKKVNMKTSKVGKIKTALQMITIYFLLIIIASNSLFTIDYNIFQNILHAMYILMIITSITTFYTGLHYLIYNHKKLFSMT